MSYALGVRCGMRDGRIRDRRLSRHADARKGPVGAYRCHVEVLITHCRQTGRKSPHGFDPNP
eukprot:6732302-Prymnesium_polylepis.2